MADHNALPTGDSMSDPNVLAHIAGIAAVQAAGFEVIVTEGLLQLPADHQAEAMCAYNRAMVNASNQAPDDNISDKEE